MKIYCLLLLFGVTLSNGEYKVNPGKIGSLNTMIISNDKGDQVVIVTDYGGRVETLKIRSQTTNVMRDVLLGHNGNETAITENQFWKGMLLIPWANRIAYGKYTFFNETYSLHLNDPPRQNSLHGFMYDKVLEVYNIEEDETHGSFMASVLISNEPGYPFSLAIDIKYTLEVKGFSISVNVANINGDGKPLPFYMGWHPYFRSTTYKSFVTLDQCTKWAHVQLNDNLDPTGITVGDVGIFDGSQPIGGTENDPTFYDDEYKALTGPLTCGLGTQNVKLYDPPTNQTIVLWYDDAFHYIHIFTGSMSALNEDSVAIEPMSGMADAYNNHDGLTIISDGETWTGNFGIYIE